MGERRKAIPLSYAGTGTGADRAFGSSGPPQRFNSGMPYAIAAAVVFPPIGVFALVLSIRAVQSWRRGEALQAIALGQRALKWAAVGMGAFLMGGLAFCMAGTILTSRGWL